MNQLNQAGIPVYIVSNCQKGYIETFLAAYGIKHLIKGHLCSGETGKPKDQNLTDLIMENNLHSPVYIGDTSNDREAAMKNGIQFIHATYGFCPKLDSMYKAKTVGELSQLLLGG